MDALLFTLDARRCAIRLADVSEVVPAVEAQVLPGAPAIVESVVNVRGDIVPVIALRARMGLPPRAIVDSEYFIIARARSRRVILRSDSTPEIVALGAQPQAEEGGVGRALAGVVALADGLALIHDVEHLLSAAEDGALTDMIARAAARA